MRDPRRTDVAPPSGKSGGPAARAHRRRLCWVLGVLALGALLAGAPGAAPVSIAAQLSPTPTAAETASTTPTATPTGAVPHTRTVVVANPDSNFDPACDSLAPADRGRHSASVASAHSPTLARTPTPRPTPTPIHTARPTAAPTAAPTKAPPTASPTAPSPISPSVAPSPAPTAAPTAAPSPVASTGGDATRSGGVNPLLLLLAFVALAVAVIAYRSNPSR